MYHYCKVVHFSFGQLEEKTQLNILIPLDTKHHQSFPDRGCVALIPKIILDFFWQTVGKLLQWKEATGKRRFSMSATGTKGLIVY